MKNNIDFTTITACGECCVGCRKSNKRIQILRKEFYHRLVLSRTRLFRMMNLNLFEEYN